MRKKVLILSLITLIVFTTVGGLIAVNSFADNISYFFVNTYSTPNNSTNILTYGSLILTTGNADLNYTYSYKVLTSENSIVKVALVDVDNTHTDLYFASPVQFTPYYLCTDDRWHSVIARQCDIQYNNMYYHFEGNVYTYTRNPDIPIFSSKTEALEYLDNGVWEEPSPVDPSYQFDINLGYLRNVQWKQIAVPSTNETMLEISYDQYTSTGVNLMNSGMGVMCRYQAYNSIDSVNPFWHSTPILTTPGQVLQVIVDWIKVSESLVLQSIGLDGVLPGPGGGGHSFGKPEGNQTDSNGVQINNSIYYFDVILTPYYYDGVDYYYGYNTTINDVYFDYIGNRIIPTENDFVDTDTYLNNGSVNNFYYDYGLESNYIDQSTNFYYYTTNNVFNYTGVTDDPTEITFNDIENSTNNVYNFTGVGSIPDIDFDGFNVSPAEMLNAIRGVLTAMVVASPLLMGLFDFLPFWAISIAVSCCIAVCVICVIRIFKVV